MKYYQSPRISDEFLDCGMPMTFDTYSNCAFSCQYCFSQFQRAVGSSKDDYLSKTVNHVNVDKVKKLFLTEGEGTCFEGFIKNKVVMQWGGLSDAFDGFERNHGISLELMKFFKEINYPLSFSTKGTWFMNDKRYVDVIRGTENIWHFKVSIITLDNEKSKGLERGVKPPLERIDTIKKIAELGNPVTLRFRPFIIGVSSPRHVELIELAAKAGAYSVSTEFLCIEGRSVASAKDTYQCISDIVGYDIVDFYKENSYTTGLMRLNRKLKAPYINDIIAACDENNLRLGVSDAHLKTSGNCGGCCGLPDNFNYFKGQLTEAIINAKKEGRNEISLGDIEPNMDFFKKFTVASNKSKTGLPSAAGLNCGTSVRNAKIGHMTMFEYVKSLWNSPKKGRSPYKYTQGDVIPIKLDNKNNVVYKLNNNNEQR